MNPSSDLQPHPILLVAPPHTPAAFLHGDVVPTDVVVVARIVVLARIPPVLPARIVPAAPAHIVLVARAVVARTAGAAAAVPLSAVGWPRLHKWGVAAKSPIHPRPPPTFALS